VLRKRVLSLLVLIAACTLIGVARHRVAAECRAVKSKSDVFALPPPSTLTLMSLGYRSALADVLFAETLIQYGIHGEERRRFEFAGAYLDSIFALDPQFCQAYRFADTFMIFQAIGNPSEADVRLARRLVETGFTNCPSDAPLWLSGGQFLAFLAPQFLADEAEKKAFREAGALAMAHAAELSGYEDRAGWKSLAAAGILTREGKRDAAISFLERVYSATDSEELRADVGRRLRALQAEEAGEAARQRMEAFQAIWHADLPFVSRNRLLVLGPPRTPSHCSGRRATSAPDRDCAVTWAQWAQWAEP
jgi:hypothetical protein